MADPPPLTTNSTIKLAAAKDIGAHEDPLNIATTVKDIDLQQFANDLETEEEMERRKVRY